MALVFAGMSFIPDSGVVLQVSWSLCLFLLCSPGQRLEPFPGLHSSGWSASVAELSWLPELG